MTTPCRPTRWSLGGGGLPKSVVVVVALWAAGASALLAGPPKRQLERRTAVLVRERREDLTDGGGLPDRDTTVGGGLTTDAPPPPRDSAQQRLARLAQRSVRQAEVLNNIALVNAVVIAFVSLAALYELLHVDVEAIVALYTYPVEVSRFATSLDLIARLPMDAIHSYEALVPTNPVFYKACTSGVAYTLGDFVSQVYQGKDLDSFDLQRSARSGAAGFIGHGPLCHYWMVWMEASLDFGGAWWGTGLKVLADQTVWSLYLNGMYSFLIGALALRKPSDIWADVRTTSWPALRSSWRFWPFVHVISFSHVVPLDLKLLWIDAMEIIWVTILSRVANEDKAVAVEAGEEVIDEWDDEDVTFFGVDPSLEIELTREVELVDQTRPGFGLKEVVLAAWPLAAIFPILYAAHDFELFLQTATQVLSTTTMTTT